MPLVTSTANVQENVSTRPVLEESAAFSPIATATVPLTSEQQAALESTNGAFGQLWAETKLHEGIENLQEKTDEVKEDVNDKAQDLKEKAADVKEDAKDAAKDAKSNLQETADAAVSKMQEAGHVALEKGKELVSTMQEKMQGASEVAREKGKEFVEVVQEKAGEAKALGQEKASEVQNKLEEWKDVAFEKTADARDSAAHALAPVQHVAASVAEHMKEAALVVGHVVTDAVHTVQEKLHLARHDSDTSFTQLKDDQPLHAAPVLNADELPPTL